MTKMAARFIRLLCISSTVCMIVCSLPAIDAQVPHGFVYTDLHKLARKGDRLVLKCEFFGTPIAVYWKKGDDPTKSPDLVTWVEGEPPSGSCLADKSCIMDHEYSLIIYTTKVADQGTYICRVSNKGILMHNFTDVAVYAPPMEPFPVIKECPVKHPNDTEKACSLSTSDSVTITCSASSYFPDIDLFILQGSQKLGTTDTEEATNPDGTKNKSISAVAEPTEIPYVCVASDIPGSQDQRTVLIEVNYLNATINKTIPRQTTVLPVRGVAKVVVPVVIVVVLLLTVLCVAALWRRRRKQGKTKNVRQQAKDGREGIPLCGDPKTGENRIISLSFKRSVLRRWFWRGLFRPHDVIYYKGKYFITNMGHHCVSSYNPKTRDHKTECWVIGSKLYGLASLSDTDQGILVTDNLGGRVYRIDNSVRYDWASGLNAPTGITTHKGQVFVAEFHDIKVYDEKGNHLQNFNSKSYLRKPRFLAVNSKDRLYVADSEAIKVFTTVGEYIGSFKISNDGNWLNRGIAVDCYDNVFVTARDGRGLNATETIAVFNSEHKCVKRFRADSQLLHYTRGLCINYQNNELAVVDGGWHRLKLFELYES